jgi:hypothetical protein
MCLGASAQLISTLGNTYTWSPATSLSNTIIANPIATPSITTIYTVIINNNSAGFTCSKTLTTSVVVYNLPNSVFTTTNSVCANTLIAINTSTNSPSVNYQFNWGDGTPTNTTIGISTHTYTNNGTYTLTLNAIDANGCTSSSTKTISVFNFTTAVNTTSVCFGASSSFTAQGGTSYTWQPTTGISNPFIFNP